MDRTKELQSLLGRWLVRHVVASEVVERQLDLVASLFKTFERFFNGTIATQPSNGRRELIHLPEGVGHSMRGRKLVRLPSPTSAQPGPTGLRKKLAGTQPAVKSALRFARHGQGRRLI
jgi:hypothetical protein